MTNKGRSRLLALIMLLLFYILLCIANKSFGQAKQYRVERICLTYRDCLPQHRAFVALTDSMLYVRCDSLPLETYKIDKWFEYKGRKYYKLSGHRVVNGLFVIYEYHAVLDVSIFDYHLFRRFEIYHFKR